MAADADKVPQQRAIITSHTVCSMHVQDDVLRTAPLPPVSYAAAHSRKTPLPPSHGLKQSQAFQGGIIFHNNASSGWS